MLWVLKGSPKLLGNALQLEVHIFFIGFKENLKQLGGISPYANVLSKSLVLYSVSTAVYLEGDKVLSEWLEFR